MRRKNRGPRWPDIRIHNEKPYIHRINRRPYVAMFAWNRITVLIASGKHVIAKLTEQKLQTTFESSATTTWTKKNFTKKTTEIKWHWLTEKGENPSYANDGNTN